EGSGRARPLIGSGTDLSRRHLKTPPPCLSVVIQLTPRKPNPATCWEIRDDSAGHVLIPIAVVELQVAIVRPDKGVGVDARELLALASGQEDDDVANNVL